jgi:hypothetical protein
MVKLDRDGVLCVCTREIQAEIWDYGAGLKILLPMLFVPSAAQQVLTPSIETSRYGLCGQTNNTAVSEKPSGPTRIPLANLKGDPHCLGPLSSGPTAPECRSCPPRGEADSPLPPPHPYHHPSKPKVWSGNVIFHPAISDVSGLRGPDSRRSEIRSSVHDMRHRVDQFHDIYHQNG